VVDTSVCTIEVIKKPNDDACRNEASEASEGDFTHIDGIIDSLFCDLSDLQRSKVISLIKQNADLFSRHDYDIGRTSLSQAKINAGNAAPISEPLRRHAKVHLEKMDEAVERMQNAGLITWSANLVIVNKPGSATHGLHIHIKSH